MATNPWYVTAPMRSLQPLEQYFIPGLSPHADGYVPLLSDSASVSRAVRHRYVLRINEPTGHSLLPLVTFYDMGVGMDGSGGGTCTRFPAVK